MKFSKGYKTPTKVEAYFGGECDECGEEINGGDYISFYEPTREWMHHDCTIEALDMEGTDT